MIACIVRLLCMLATHLPYPILISTPPDDYFTPFVSPSTTGGKSGGGSSFRPASFLFSLPEPEGDVTLATNGRLLSIIAEDALTRADSR